LHSFWLQANLFNDFLYAVYPASGIAITFQVMTITFQSTSNHDAIDAILQCMQHYGHIQPSRTRQLYNLDSRGILQPQTASQIRGSIGTVFAAVSDNLI
jgi:hypothetical protein